MKKEILLLLPILFIVIPLWSQQDSLEVDYTFETFRSPVVVSGQSVETNSKNNLNFEIYHRFGQIDQNFAGLDKKVNIRWGFTYGLTDELTIGFGRSKFSGTWDFYGKAKILKQSSGAKIMPVTLTAYSNFVLRTTSQGVESNSKGGKGNEEKGNGKENGEGNGKGGGKGNSGEENNSNKGNQGGERYNSLNGYEYAWNTQLLFARKFGEKLSLQLSPTMVYLFTNNKNINNLHFALGFGVRYKINWRWSLLGEYYYNFTEVENIENIGKEKYWGLGVEINTAMHTFNITLGSTQHMNEDVFAINNYSKTNENNSSMHVGFNIIIRNYF